MLTRVDVALMPRVVVASSKTSGSCGIDAYSRRLVHNGLRGRVFRIKYRLPTGAFIEEPTSISAGLSPLLCFMFFDGIQAELDDF